MPVNVRKTPVPPWQAYVSRPTGANKKTRHAARLNAKLYAVQNGINLGTTNQKLVFSVEHTHSHTMPTTIRRLKSKSRCFKYAVEICHTINCVLENQ